MTLVKTSTVDGAAALNCTVLRAQCIFRGTISARIYSVFIINIAWFDLLEHALDIMQISYNFHSVIIHFAADVFNRCRASVLYLTQIIFDEIPGEESATKRERERVLPRLPRLVAIYRYAVLLLIALYIIAFRDVFRSRRVFNKTRQRTEATNVRRRSSLTGNYCAATIRCGNLRAQNNRKLIALDSHVVDFLTLTLCGKNDSLQERKSWIK